MKWKKNCVRISNKSKQQLNICRYENIVCWVNVIENMPQLNRKLYETHIKAHAYYINVFTHIESSLFNNSFLNWKYHFVERGAKKKKKETKYVNGTIRFRLQWFTGNRFFFLFSLSLCLLMYYLFFLSYWVSWFCSIQRQQQQQQSKII